MARLIEAPQQYKYEADNVFVFLAGSIEMGKAEEWQNKVIDELDLLFPDDDVVILNPRRKDWDSSWEQRAENLQFREQVEWELEGLSIADIVLFYFSPGSMSPITLLELGRTAGDSNEIVVFCPEGYARKGNVDIFCERYGLDIANSWEEVYSQLKEKIQKELSWQ